jgi:DNA-directed RNA polymerase subunit M/transcription elongation factor TFIIS
MNRQTVREYIDTRFADLTEEQRIDLERGIYNASLTEADKKGIRKHWENPDFAQIYKTIARRTVINLDPKSYIGNGRLLERLKDGEFKPHQIAYMNSREMYPENWQDLADAQLKRENSMQVQEEGTDLFTCRRCGKSKTRHWEMQTRSADEPMTIFIRCLNCGKEWRQ